jgi:mannose-6-phosphate isomerase-like protein (cupin superfamily)
LRKQYNQNNAYPSDTTYLDKQNMRNGEILQPKIVKVNAPHEYLTPERCYIAENFSDKDVSIARATVKPGITTKAHHLEKIQEIYIITAGEGKVAFSGLEPATVSVGDVIVIPAGASQKITNTGQTDLVFYCVCTPRFTEECYFDDGEEKSPE